MSPIGICLAAALFVRSVSAQVVGAWNFSHIVANMDRAIEFLRAVRRVGYPGIMSVATVVPILNLVMVGVLGFSEWPVLKELEALRHKTTPSLLVAPCSKTLPVSQQSGVSWNCRFLPIRA